MAIPALVKPGKELKVLSYPSKVFATNTAVYVADTGNQLVYIRGGIHQTQAKF
jgi:hypothetical protein